MDNFYGRSVFFVKDAERSLAFYTQTLGFSLDWNHQEEGRAFVFQVSLFGFQVILNTAERMGEPGSGTCKAGGVRNDFFTLNGARLRLRTPRHITRRDVLAIRPWLVVVHDAGGVNYE